MRMRERFGLVFLVSLMTVTAVIAMVAINSPSSLSSAVDPLFVVPPPPLHLPSSPNALYLMVRASSGTVKIPAAHKRKISDSTSTWNPAYSYVAGALLLMAGAIISIIGGRASRGTRGVHNEYRRHSSSSVTIPLREEISSFQSSRSFVALATIAEEENNNEDTTTSVLEASFSSEGRASEEAVSLEKARESGEEAPSSEEVLESDSGSRLRVTNKFEAPLQTDNNPLFKFADLVFKGRPPKLEELTDLLNSTQETIREDVLPRIKSADDLKYWGYHTARTGFFVTSALLSSATSGLELLPAKTDDESAKVANERSRLESAKGLLIYVLDVFRNYEMDAENISQGYYRAPYDMDVKHKQFSPVYILTRLRRLLKVATETIDRKDRNGFDEIPLDSKFYPEYYKRTFHFQTDGWLSSNSAIVYEFQTETLFLGGQDAMQRQVLVPVFSYMQKMIKAGKRQSDMKVLEVAGGTGRLMTFFRDNYPSMDATLLELSPYYLEEAGKNDAYWRKLFAKNGSRSAEPAPTPLKLIQGLAEDMPLEENTYDIITCVYLFHELPNDVRGHVVKSFFKHLKPGGLVAFNDSIQLGDRAEVDEKLSLFPKRFHEPFYNDYVKNDVNKLFLEAGFLPGPVEPIISNRSKILCWIKPE